MNYSFYGGRKGNSFIIAGRFSNIDDMIRAFKSGPEYQEIHFDEYVLIDTKNKNNRDNGKIYKRGYNYSNEFGGAEYIGQIVGPSGPAPELQLSTMDNVKETATTENVKLYSGSYKMNTGLVPGFIPGSDENTNQYNDEIQWNACSIRNEDNTEATAYIGFTFPYLVIDFTAKSEDAYYPKKLIEKDSATSSHPFYDKYTIHIPKGVKGDAITNISQTIASKEDGVERYDNQALDREKGNTILTYMHTNYDTEIPIETKQYLGPYTMIKDVELDTKVDEKPLKITFTHSIPIEQPDGSVRHEKEKLFHFNQIQDTAITPNGHLFIEYSDPKARGTEEYENKKVWTDVGLVRSPSGILIGKHVEYPESENSAIIAHLNQDYPNGFQGDANYEKVITVGQAASVAKAKKFFAFNHDPKYHTWYYLGSIGESVSNAPSCMALTEKDSLTNPVLKLLPKDSLLFILEETSQN